ncbi:MAG: helix-turn-helix domain-containing protein, partial [Lachnospiraceae bacterium]|nr:helix-turn-helix domain-containing protein [Lachnospiraceae bacterium]
KEMISITHEQAARELGTAREVITRMLKHLQDEGLIRISRGAVEIIDFDGLFALAKESIR